eukprot:gnl/MRDRNA2_/MRDRNA2_84019_c0_seq5.p1 gnl/MRDRNA2_/MRDRNA2_84019_c0~~gnl/MRDRNA2_/MRDRNA2_84019_c0_seq5.p1  ORF type:complete len:402 (-),score=74.32 gnl/MRDRNA2_/MRDRNA2_84019_c0_seq5:137-1342(-)
MFRTSIIVLLAFVPALAQVARDIVSKPGHLKVAPPKSKFPSPGSHLRAPHLQVPNAESRARLTPPAAFAPVYAPAFAPQLEDLVSKSLPDDFHDARALAPGVKERIAQKAVEDAFIPRAPSVPQTGLASGGGASGFAPEYAPAYAPSFFGSAKPQGATASYRAPAYDFTAPANAAQEVPRHITHSEPSSGASGFAPEYAPAYAPAFFGSAKKSATTYQSASMGSVSHEFTPAYAADAYAPQASTSSGKGSYSESSSGKGSGGFAPLFAPAYAPEFFGSAHPTGARAPMFRDVVRESTSSFSAPAPTFNTPLGPREGAYSSSKGTIGGASGFAPEYAPAYAPGFMGKPQVMDLNTIQTSPHVSGTIAVALLGVSISGVAIAVLCLHRKTSTALEEVYLPAPN